MQGKIISIFSLLNCLREIKIKCLLTKIPLLSLMSLQKNFLEQPKISLVNPSIFSTTQLFLFRVSLKKHLHHSSQQFDFVLSFDYYFSVQSWVKTWGNTGPHNFVLLKKGTDINAFNKKIAGVIAANSDDTTRSLFAAKFSDNYLLNSFDHGSQVGSKIEYVRLFSLIAIFILVIACINFMNLSTAKASRRMKEVGIKKVVGAKSKTTHFSISFRIYHAHFAGNGICCIDRMAFTSPVQSAYRQTNLVNTSI